MMTLYYKAHRVNSMMTKGRGVKIAGKTRVYFSYDFFWPSGGMCNLAGIGAKNLKFCEPRSRDSLVFDQ